MLNEILMSEGKTASFDQIVAALASQPRFAEAFTLLPQIRNEDLVLQSSAAGLRCTRLLMGSLEDARHFNHFLSQVPKAPRGPRYYRPEDICRFGRLVSDFCSTGRVRDAISCSSNRNYKQRFDEITNAFAGISDEELAREVKVSAGEGPGGVLTTEALLNFRVQIEILAFTIANATASELLKAGSMSVPQLAVARAQIRGAEESMRNLPGGRTFNMEGAAAGI